MRRLISTRNVPVVLGAQSSTVTLAMAPIAEKNKVVIISGASTAPKVGASSTYVFRTCPSDIHEGIMMAHFFEQQFKNASLAVLYINNDYGVGLRNAFLNSLKKKPSKLIDLAYSQGKRNFRSLLTKIKKEHVDVTYLVGYEEMVTIFKQSKQLGLKCKWLGNNQLNDASLLTKLGDTADGTIFPGQEFDVEKVKKKNRNFYKRYMKISGGVELDVFAAYGADALMVVNAMMLSGATTGIQIRDALKKMKKFEGITGTFSFDADGNAIRTARIYKIMGGRMLPFMGKM